MTKQIEESPELKQQPKKLPREIATAKRNMEKRRLKLIAERDALNEEIKSLDESLLPWM